MSIDLEVDPYDAAATSQPNMAPLVQLVVLFGCLGTLLFGYDTGIVSGALVLVRQDIPLSTEQAENVVSITLILAALSTIAGVPLNAAFGRRFVIMAAALLYTCGSAIVACSVGINSLLLGRAVLGVGVGLASGTVPMYLAEMAPAEWRGTILTLNDLNIVLGELLATVANMAFKDTFGSWRWSMGLAAGPAMVLFAGFHFLLPESPRWLLMKGRTEEARAILLRLVGPEHVAAAVAEVSAGLKAAEGADSKGERLQLGGLRKLVQIWTHAEVRRAALLGIFLMALNQFSGINTVMYYSTTILIASGFSRDSSIALACACGLAQLVGVLISVASMDSKGRRVTALCSCAGVVLALSTLAASFSFEGPLASALKVGALMTYLLAFGSGLSSVPWVVNAEIFPLRLRATGMGQATVSCWLFNWLVGRYFLTVCETLGVSAAFGIFAICCAVGGLVLWRFLPETAGLDLEDVSKLFQDPFPSSLRTDMDTPLDEFLKAETPRDRHRHGSLSLSVHASRFGNQQADQAFLDHLVTDIDRRTDISVAEDVATFPRCV